MGAGAALAHVIDQGGCDHVHLNEAGRPLGMFLIPPAKGLDRFGQFIYAPQRFWIEHAIRVALVDDTQHQDVAEIETPFGLVVKNPRRLDPFQHILGIGVDLHQWEKGPDPKVKRTMITVVNL